MTHAGCWNHDLIEIYKRLGHACELSTQVYRVHAFYRVALDQAGMGFSFLAGHKLMELETDIQGTINALMGAVGVKNMLKSGLRCLKATRPGRWLDSILKRGAV